MRQTLSSDAQPPMDLYNGLVDSHSGSITGRLRYMAPEVAVETQPRLHGGKRQMLRHGHPKSPPCKMDGASADCDLFHPDDV